MQTENITRYRRRALMAASSIGLLIAGSIGSAYFGGTLIAKRQKDFVTIAQAQAMASSASSEAVAAYIVEQTARQQKPNVTPESENLANEVSVIKRRMDGLDAAIGLHPEKALETVMLRKDLDTLKSLQDLQFASMQGDVPGRGVAQLVAKPAA